MLWIRTYGPLHPSPVLRLSTILSEVWILRNPVFLTRGQLVTSAKGRQIYI
jgi:hypothetical protein